MRKFLQVLLVGLILSCTGIQSQSKNKELQEFAMDLCSANVKLRGKLMLFGEYKGNLSTLTYRSYITLLEKNETESNQGLARTIRESNKQIFCADSNSFCLVIYSKELNAVIFDDSNTSTIDSVELLQDGNVIPDLRQFIRHTRFNKNE